MKEKLEAMCIITVVIAVLCSIRGFSVGNIDAGIGWLSAAFGWAALASKYYEEDKKTKKE